MTQVYYDKHLCRVFPWPGSLQRTLVGEPYFYMWGPTEFNCTGTLKGFDHTPRFNEINVPMLFTAAEYDEARPETVEWYHSLVADSEIVIFENASHEHHLEVPEEYFAVVGDFLERSEDASRRPAKEVPSPSSTTE